jgi:DNA-binding LacI/PurR family transcriptional regulator
MANLSEVAARAGVSVRTVSNVVNDYPHVSNATRTRVRQALEELGYRPNLAARQLRRGHTGLIGLVVPEIASPYFGELASAVVAAAAERGWTVLIDETGGDAERERLLLGSSGARLVDGLIFSPWSIGAGELHRQPGAVPVVLLGERYADGVVDHVAIDNIAAAEEATTHLLALGRRRIAAIGLQPHLSNNTAALRVRGYRAALRRAGIRPQRGLEVAVRYLHRSDGAQATRRLLVHGPHVDALFCFTDQLALGALRVLADAGMRVPDDVAVLGFDDIEDGRYAVPSLSTIAPAKDEIAAAALDRLLSRIESGDEAVRDIVASHRLTPRESTLGQAGRGQGATSS